MKNLFLTLVLLSSYFTLAQNDIVAPEPDFEGEISFVKDGKELVELEMVTTSMKSGQSVGRMLSGIGKVKARVVAKGKTSTTVIQKDEIIYFIYNHGSNNLRPDKVAQLLKFEQRKKTREYLIASSSNVSGQTETNVVEGIKFKGSKYGETSYLIKVSNLEPGEYAFFVGTEETYDGNFFTVVE
ncbi:hypothetical protein LX97_00909 [Nonlabens dokdonensis]|uniref:Secreted protein n=2 Tax=Nonlabens dokdonensis TaxID=328515 RepID=L7W3T9_NONDD|nr:hypothetical protein [Nonlabens dokdonensis]AGC76240.1 hypothetical protein DDD_1113 [Nonlabens dokdonensis DSW-6]PZX43904.1 hypothetical protein LX97_00909 [Nonlabens dokdonensis]